jgi:hypothetical protein
MGANYGIALKYIAFYGLGGQPTERSSLRRAV